MKWEICEPNERLQQLLFKELSISPVIAQLLINRGIRAVKDARDFLFGDLTFCHDPFLMKGMKAAVPRIKEAISKKEKIMIYGDYDVDGVTSVAVLASVLSLMGADYETFIPNRMEDGYGLNITAVTNARDKGVKLLITVDCGINSVKEVECANECGIDVIITDHHVVKARKPPPAYAIIDPHQSDCEYPFKNLAGVGVAYKLARALVSEEEEQIDAELDMVALGTIADIVPLNGENRILAKAGLKKLRSGKRAGIKALLDVARLDPEKLTCRHIGFVLGPRINAMGRISSADIALDLLMSRDSTQAREIAQILDQENKNRQGIEKDILKQALEMVKEQLEPEKQNIIVLADESWHPGVIGIVASRITESYNRPAILIALEGEDGKGSGRGIDGFDLFGAIQMAGEHLEDFGGHKQACGLRIKKDKINLFRSALNERSEEVSETEKAPCKKLYIDLCLPFSHINLKLAKELDLLMPYGPENETPVFCLRGLRVNTAPKNIGKNGMKFYVSCGNITGEALTFKKDLFTKPRIGDIVDLAFTLSVNTWNGVDSVQMTLKDLHII